MSWKVRAASVAGVSCLLLAASAFAAVSPPASTRTELVPSAGSKTIRATCPRHRAPVGGGFVLPDPQGGIATVDRSRFRRRGWTTRVTNRGDDASASSIAYCAHLGRTVAVRRARMEIGPSAAAEVTARCRRFEQVVSGGFAIIGASENLNVVTGSSRSGRRRWTVTADNQTASTLVALANCVPVRRAPDLRERTTTRPLIFGFPVTATAECKPGEHVVSGGFRAPDPSFANVPLVISSQSVSSRDWTLRALSGTDTAMLTSVAYCEADRR